jgi:hypothetical protein
LAGRRKGLGKGLVYLTALFWVAGTLVLLVVTPLNWLKYAESQRIQHGPEVIATLRSESVSNADSSRGVQRYTTRFQVAFTTVTGQPVRTVVGVHGYRLLPIGDRFAIRYDPGAPSHAEVPGAPMHALGAAITLTVLTAVALSIVLGLGRVAWIERARRRRARNPTLAADPG